MKRVLLVNAVWDDEAQVWVATSDDVPGLATESDTWEALMHKLRTLVPELLEANGVADLDDVPLEVLGRRFENVRRIAAWFSGAGPAAHGRFRGSPQGTPAGGRLPFRAPGQGRS